MNTAVTTTAASVARPKAATVAVPVKPPATRATKPPALTAASREAKQRAAAILEVLAGVRTPTDAALALGVSVPRYYLLEERALQGLVQACEAQPRGRSGNFEVERARLQRECQRWQQECGRQQALVRAAQRTIGLTAAAATPAKQARGQRRRRPTRRALRAVARLQTPQPASTEAAVSTAAATPS